MAGSLGQNRGILKSHMARDSARTKYICGEQSIPHLTNQFPRIELDPNPNCNMVSQSVLDSLRH